MIVIKRFFYLFLSWFLVTSLLLWYKGLFSFILPFGGAIVGCFLCLMPLMRKASSIIYGMLVLFSLFLGMEMASLWNTGRLVTALLLLNIREIGAVDPVVVYSSILIVVLYLLSVFVFRNSKPVLVSKWAYLLVLPWMALCYFEEIHPVISFGKTLAQYVRQKMFEPDKIVKERQKRLYGKKWVYRDEPSVYIPDIQGKNVVVIFTEGMSLRIIDKFSRYPNLTPNISDFLDKSVWFDNYFNHTAATYRGLRGQLTSSFQYTNGEHLRNENFDNDLTALEAPFEDGLISLPEILRKNGYHTYFLSGRSREERLNSYLSTIGFDHVFTASEFKSSGNDLTDLELFLTLNKLVGEGHLQEPYFIGVYNVGTHFGMRSSGIVYDNEGQSDNDMLNIFHNYDFAFGKFFHYVFENENLRKNLAVVLTSDHATFPDKEFIETFDDYYNGAFLGRIPLILYYEGVIPLMMQAKGKSSLDFAPTLLHWLRIQNAYNYFLGCSLHHDECPYNFHYVFNSGDRFYRTFTGQKMSKDVFRDAKIIGLIQNFYHLSE